MGRLGDDAKRLEGVLRALLRECLGVTWQVWGFGKRSTSGVAGYDEEKFVRLVPLCTPVLNS